MSADATVRVNADTSKAVAAIDRLNKSLTAVKLDSLLNLAQRAGDAGGSVIALASKFENLQVRLKTIEGSTAAAGRAFEGLRQFATQVPLTVEEVVNSFIKLKTLGLDPSQEALESYTNTALAMGKSLDQLVEAVADAAMGEFERLKEFGIKAKKQGDEIEFIFKGVSTTVKNNSKEIQEYLMQIGQTEFAGAANEQMQTLSGTISNLTVAWENLADALIKASGAGDWFIRMSNSLTNVMNTITAGVEGVRYPIAEAEAQIASLVQELEHLERVGATVDFDEFGEKTDESTSYVDELKNRLAQARAELVRLKEEAAGGIIKITVDDQGQEQREVIGAPGAVTEVDLIKQQEAQKLEEQRLAAQERFRIQSEFQEMMLGTELAYWYGSSEAAAMSYADQLTALEDFHRAKLLSDEQYAAAKQNIESQVKQNAIDSLKELGTAFGGQSKEMFAAMQAYNIATAIMNTYTAATEALKLPFPLNWIQMGAVIASGMAQVATIKAQKYQGRMYGGTITGNQPYLVGERGPEIVTPGRTGTVTPNDEIGGKVVNITFDISATDAEGFDELLTQRKPLIVGMIRQAVSEQPDLLGA